MYYLCSHLACILYRFSPCRLSLINSTNNAFITIVHIHHIIENSSTYQRKFTRHLIYKLAKVVAERLPRHSHVIIFIFSVQTNLARFIWNVRNLNELILVTYIINLLLQFQAVGSSSLYSGYYVYKFYNNHLYEI